MVTNFHVIVPARKGSKGVVGKNKLLLGGKELFQWSVDAAKFMNIPATVSTNDEEILGLCKSRGIDVLQRPEAYAQDYSLDREFLTHFIHEKKLLNRPHDVVVNLRPTSPLRSKRDLIEFRKLLFNTTSSIRSVKNASFTPYKMWFNENGSEITPVLKHELYDEPYNMPRQKLPRVYEQTGAFDSYCVADILSGKLNGNMITGFFQNSIIVDIDTEEDFKYASLIYAKEKYQYNYDN